MNYLKSVYPHSRLVGLFVLVGLLAAAAFTFAQPLRFGATVRMLIIQRSAYGLDPYTAVKSAERIADNLSLVVHTEDFLQKTLAQDQNIDQKQFPADANRRVRFWNRVLRARLTPGTGLLSLTAYATEKFEAERIAQAAGNVLIIHGREYIGGDLEVKLVDSPHATPYPVSPNIPLNFGLGALLGLLVGIGYSFWKGNRVEKFQNPNLTINNQ
ncbi:hypothetical protein EPN90_02930 [Patescibacteria group bacterium]|nr:MAG: hypothetical protein EPN90_02930 [Patescibacteria group bacterium]